MQEQSDLGYTICNLVTTFHIPHRPVKRNCSDLWIILTHLAYRAIAKKKHDISNNNSQF